MLTAHCVKDALFVCLFNGSHELVAAWSILVCVNDYFLSSSPVPLSDPLIWVSIPVIFNPFHFRAHWHDTNYFWHVIFDHWQGTTCCMKGSNPTIALLIIDYPFQSLWHTGRSSIAHQCAAAQWLKIAGLYSCLIFLVGFLVLARIFNLVCTKLATIAALKFLKLVYAVWGKKWHV